MKLHCPGVAVAALLIIVVLTGQGCKGSDAPGGVKITTADRQEAHQIFTTRCAACHGQFGRGDGPGAAGLNPKPRNYADPAWQSATSDEEIEKAIVYGGAAVGKSLQMVANPDLQAKPAVVAALREIVRTFGKN